MFLFLEMVLCLFFSVFSAERIQAATESRALDNYTGSVALQYIAGKIRQNDEAGTVRVTENNGASVLELEKNFGDNSYLYQIYYDHGSIRELLTPRDSLLQLEDGIVVLECEGLSMKIEGGLLAVETAGRGGGRLFLSIRSQE